MTQRKPAPRRSGRRRSPKDIDDALARSLPSLLRKVGATFPKASASQLIREKPVILKRLAKVFVQQCFRNTVIEDYHAGRGCGSKGSAITQAQMKALMIEAVNNAYSFLWVLFREEIGPSLLADLEVVDPVAYWNDPELDPKFATGAVAMLRCFAAGAEKD